MGKNKGAYNAEYPVGTKVRIADLPVLKNFKTQWLLHHPLDSIQLEFAGRTAEVVSVGFYHGGDELYELEGIPGIWHEVCIELAGNEKQDLKQ